ncbi:MAG: hypothetical protein IJ127_23305 [Afipia sp.]|nr:hypothetical protein [Afipia sp.]MBS4003839.1 hypothetical protein [Afipia sp.]
MTKSRFEIQPSLHPLMTSGRWRTNVLRSGLAVGLILGAWHLMWSTLVAAGLAQPVADFVFWMHFIKPVYLVESFDAYRAIVLVSLTFAIGFGIGSMGAIIWYSVARSSQ